MRHLFYLLPFLFILTACGPDYLMEENQPIAAGNWNYDDAKVFSFSIEDTSQFYTLHLRLEHAQDFFAQNLYVKVFTTFPSGEQLEEEVSLQLADKFGQWFGNCDNEVCTIDISIQPVAYFEQAGNYEISIAQHSRREPLAGVNAVGFAVERLGKEPPAR